MKKGWEYKTLGEVAEFISGYTPPKEFIVSQGNIPYFKVAEMNLLGNELYLTRTNLYVERTKRIIPQGSIVFPKNGGAIFTNKKRIMSQDSVVDLNTEALNPNKSYTTTEFLYYILQFIDLGSFDNGGGLPSINIRKMKGHPIPVPPLSEQEEIVSRLDKAFEKIDTLRHNAEQSLTTAQQLFQSSLTNLLTPQPHWERRTLPQLSENLDSKRIPVTKNQRKEGVYPYYGASGIVDYVDDYLFDDELLLISEDGANLLMRTYPIAFTVRGKVWVNNHAHILKFNNNTTHRYVEYYFSSIEVKEYITGAAQPKLTQKALNSILICIPSVKEQQSIVAKLDSLSAKVKQLKDNYTRTVALCDEMKQALLKEVFE